MTTSVIGLAIDCSDAATLAGFWSEALGRPVNPGAEPKTVKNRLHLDLRTDQYEAEIERLTGLGATALWQMERPAIRWTTFADPEGNEFDLVTSQPAAG
jgi:predicted enzyme related to lactoylglutathione lyase